LKSKENNLRAHVIDDIDHKSIMVIVATDTWNIDEMIINPSWSPPLMNKKRILHRHFIIPDHCHDFI